MTSCSVWVAHYENWFDTDWETFDNETDARKMFREWSTDRENFFSSTVTLRRVDGWTLGRVVAHGEEQMNRTDTGWVCWLWDLANGGVVVESVEVR
jgi:hypothetical protein